MGNDVVDLRDFYETQRGQVARRMIRRGIWSIWPDLHGQCLLGLGYATPYLRQFMPEAERVLGFMPASQGVLHWPVDGPGRVALIDEIELQGVRCRTVRLTGCCWSTRWRAASPCAA